MLGVGNGFPGYSVPDAPPDPNLAVGDTEIVERVNVEWAIFNKSNGAIIQGPQGDFTEDNYIYHLLLPGSLCDTGVQSDPIIKWDRVAHRWVMAQNVFTSPYAVCVAISQTPHIEDNLWFVYEYSVPGNGFRIIPNGVFGPAEGLATDTIRDTTTSAPAAAVSKAECSAGMTAPRCSPATRRLSRFAFTSLAMKTRRCPRIAIRRWDRPVPEDEFFIGSLADVDNSHLSLYSMHINNWATHDATMTGLNNSPADSRPNIHRVLQRAVWRCVCSAAGSF